MDYMDLLLPKDLWVADYLVDQVQPSHVSLYIELHFRSQVLQQTLDKFCWSALLEWKLKFH